MTDSKTSSSKDRRRRAHEVSAERRRSNRARAVEHATGTRKERRATGPHRVAKGARHERDVAGGGHGRVGHDGSRAHLHGLARLRRAPDARVHDHRQVNLLYEDADEVPRHQAAVGADGRAERHDERAAALIARELDGFDPIRQLYGIRLVNEAGTQNPTLVTDKNGDPKIVDGLYTVRYLYEIYPLTDVYFDVFVPRFDQLLSQISLRRPRTIFMKAKRERSHYIDNVNEDSFPYDNYSTGNFPGVMRQGSYYEIDYRDEVKEHGVIQGKKNEGVVLSIVTMMNSSLSAITAKDYFLAPKVVDAYLAWEDAYYAYNPRHCIEYFVQVQDGQGNMLAQSAFSVPTSAILLGSSMGRGGYADRAARVEWLPLLKWPESNFTSLYSTTLRSYVDVQLTAEDMANARNVSIGLMEWAQ